jgi:hypothetical protein
MMSDIIKMSITSECDPCTAITIQNKLGTFRHGAENGRKLSFKVNFASSQCSDQGCNIIVLCNCSVCEGPCSECLVHVTTCEHCEQSVYMSCLLIDGLCKNCSFICIECHNLSFVEEDYMIFCQGLRGGQPCPSAVGPYCANCAWPEDIEGPNIDCCGKCGFMACSSCMNFKICEICENVFCFECNLVRMCSRCNRFQCENCKPSTLPCDPCDQVRENLV